METTTRTPYDQEQETDTVTIKRSKVRQALDVLGEMPEHPHVLGESLIDEAYALLQEFLSLTADEKEPA